MAVDIYIMLVFYMALFKNRSWFFIPAIILGSFAIETYSLLPFGIASFALFFAVSVMRIAGDLFDASSFGARMLAFSLGIIVYSVSLASVQYVSANPIFIELCLRGALFLFHQLLLAVFVGLTLYGVFFSIKIFSYAFVEEKITF